MTRTEWLRGDKPGESLSMLPLKAVPQVNYSLNYSQSIVWEKVQEIQMEAQDRASHEQTVKQRA